MDVLRQCVIPQEADWHKAPEADWRSALPLDRANAPQADRQTIATKAYQEKIA
jgi:hypothetical protein